MRTLHPRTIRSLSQAQALRNTSAVMLRLLPLATSALIRHRGEYTAEIEATRPAKPTRDSVAPTHSDSMRTIGDAPQQRFLSPAQ